MELLKKDTAWFLTDEGGKQFAALDSLEERAIFIYSYLKTIAHESFEKDKTLFKMAFFIADAVYSSDVTYSKYPEILKADSNPFVAFLKNAEIFSGNEKTYVILTAVLNNKANAFDKSDWIYDEEILDCELEADEFESELAERGIEFLPGSGTTMPDPELYNIDSKLRLMQLQLVWIFLK